MKVKITEDGSKTVYSQQFNQTYHSIFGAKTESERVYLELGFEEASKKFDTIKILEIGFGTGLNAYLSKMHAEKFRIPTEYLGIEAFPLSEKNYSKLDTELQIFHLASWQQNHELSEFFNFKKIKIKTEDFETDESYNLIYYDAFAPETQPELWTEQIFSKMKKLLVTGGILTTYCSKVIVQKNLKYAGFKIEKHKGPPHKREVLRAVKVETLGFEKI
ncbi:hypothetical protein EGI22_07920 [Lacihabitans sp. LS3-19]|uniref:tRNA (5-methylaminomethyl-2-thiouridine)(34)-methyltransferase MnmD n=1 Tax=Lacihabitans sp. LS3-19 TaxID=2487335 RepID=UPI0020CF478A|nr:tRNA (5-methylaminomethyl-2-thiouridine)(34)-methyltransferase MnmD [Lacihabitans sp. LS3-19]MCP9767836.1 hypothetical protein [Lacihabitans sp. LS3-19]